MACINCKYCCKSRIKYCAKNGRSIDFSMFTPSWCPELEEDDNVESTEGTETNNGGNAPDNE
jgi:hypothetical protein